MVLDELSEFLKLSALINYQLSARHVVWENLLSVILGRRRLSNEERSLLQEALSFLDQAYGQRRRKLGPLAILHPLRATAILCRIPGVEPTPRDVVTELLHDFLEDIHPEDCEAPHWERLESQFRDVCARVDPPHGDVILDRLQALTLRKGEPYNRYVGRLLDQAASTPELVRVKLSDRLDNTFDMRIELEDPMLGVDFFQTMFEVLFVNSYRGYHPEQPHPANPDLDGSKRLYQLYKNTVILSLVRLKKADLCDEPTQKVCQALAHASMREAQRIVLHIFGYHHTDIARQRALLMDAMEYVHQGGIDAVTSPGVRHRLDGLFVTLFDGKGKLKELYDDKPLMIEAAFAFIAIFLSFLNNPDYYVRGVTDEGLTPQT